MKTVAILQARMGSSRLPGKVLLDLCGRPVLEWATTRLKRSETLDEVVVATSLRLEDDAIAAFCKTRSVPCFRGSEDDVLDRYYKAAKVYQAEVIVRVTGDDPLIDPQVVDAVVAAFTSHQPGIAYASNVHPRRTYPRGQDTEVFGFDALEKAWREDHDPRLREHVTQYMVRNAAQFPFWNLENEMDYSFMRWALDTASDLEFLRTVCAHIDDKASWTDIVDLIMSNPNWLEINREVVQKTV